MDISKYTTYFHDGSIHSIFDDKVDIKITIESSEINSFDSPLNFPLSERNTIKGFLHLKKIAHE